MVSDDYIKNRLCPQIEWHNKKSVSAKQWHCVLQWTSIISSFIVPVIACFEPLSIQRLLILFFGGAAAAANAFMAVRKYGEHWIRYRVVAERLTSEKHRYQARAGEYMGLDAAKSQAVLVAKVEDLLTAEVDSWACCSSQVESD